MGSNEFSPDSFLGTYAAAYHAFDSGAYDQKEKSRIQSDLCQQHFTIGFDDKVTFPVSLARESYVHHGRHARAVLAAAARTDLSTSHFSIGLGPEVDSFVTTYQASSAGVLSTVRKNQGTRPSEDYKTRTGGDPFQWHDGKTDFRSEFQVAFVPHDGCGKAVLSDSLQADLRQSHFSHHGDTHNDYSTTFSDSFGRPVDGVKILRPLRGKPAWVVMRSAIRRKGGVGLDSCDMDPSMESETNSTSASDGAVEVACEPPKKSEGPTRRPRALIIFDWDDTILPTTFLGKRGYKLDSAPPDADLQAVLDDYSLMVNSTLMDAAQLGHVMIVTNAETGWIQLTVEKFMPKSASTVAKFQHISARSMFEPTGIVTPLEWKESAFKMVIEEYVKAATDCTKGPTDVSRRSSSRRSVPSKKCQVISLGDSAHEREAVLKVCSSFKDQVLCKSLKFMERPEIDALRKEHQLIRECFHEILTHSDHLDLCIQAASI